ncbi:autophagy-related protein 3-like protein [Chrysochromulina tobinii]|uniref:Autophagy-related protein 3-like protein n=1 Tax=Chrysochromulina tobinii TaxID=1460289 RepID=A0A0M0JIP9_9EUKA|nr:autophagy-related protein 3-like protein [Chrysochromulina tobinii]|eukprot:KOO26375.1 autophagy-related protein 3-like protein [Chrysochromulina sp. CCMP291]
MGRNTALGAAEYMTPVLVQSQFTEKGVLTPAEFVAAGDMLVLRCPTWQWQAGDPARARPFLPPNKQFLLTKNVPCQRRACTLGAGAADEAQVDGVDGDAEGWVATHTSHAAKAIADEDAPDMEDMETITARTASLLSHIDAAHGGEINNCQCQGRADGILRTRTYDVSITYDKYYQCGRVWLFGYTETRQPLTQGQILEDISTDHALKTVSLEAHPHIASNAGLYASIHPCKHASVMQKLCAELRAGGKETKPEQYLFLFLKFISAVCPTIEYDYTMSVDGL